GEGESAPRIGTKEYARELRRLQIELVKLHRHVIAHGGKLLVILEGRDASGKDGTIKRIVAHLSPREVRVVAPGKPSDREDTEWYFQRYVGHLPDRKSTRLNSSHRTISYAVFCLKKKKNDSKSTQYPDVASTMIY